jgi:hypothetical protein
VTCPPTICKCSQKTIKRRGEEEEEEEQEEEEDEEEEEGEVKRHVVCTGRRATREEHSVPCRRRGETEQAHWLWDSSTWSASSVSLPFVSLPFLTATQIQIPLLVTWWVLA